MRKFAVRLEEAQRTIEFTQFPTQVVVETTAFCNLRCNACPCSLLDRGRGQMDIELFKRIIREIVENDPNTEVYPAYMGEPLMYKHIFEALSFAKSEGIRKLYLNTNALLLNPESSRRLLETGVDRVTVSLDGFSKETYESRRVGGDYDIVLNNTRELLRIKQECQSPTEIWVQLIVDEGNEHEEQAYIDYWLKQGAIVKVRPQLTWGGRVGENYLSHVELDRIPCPWLMRQIVLTWDGKAAMCDADHEAAQNLGSLAESSIKEIWQTSFKELRERHLANDFEHPLCKNCHDWKVGKSDVYHPEG